MRVLITGIAGFVGPHLAAHCLDRDHDVWGITRNATNERVPADVNIIFADMTDPRAVHQAVADVRPELVFHLAAQSYVPYSWDNPSATLRTNVEGTVNLLEAIDVYVPSALTMIACSSEEYGRVPLPDLPIRETHPLLPRSPYAVSKVAQDMLGYQYHQSRGLHIVRTRAFNHTGPGQSPRFLVADLVQQANEVAEGRRDYIEHGDLSPVRDFTDVRDVVKAYLLAVALSPGAYNICSEVGYSVADILEMAAPGAPHRRSTKRLRPSDVPLLIGDCSKFHEKTGWKPTIPLQQTMRDML